MSTVPQSRRRPKLEILDERLDPRTFGYSKLVEGKIVKLYKDYSLVEMKLT
jgi:hypothetical protein